MAANLLIELSMLRALLASGGLASATIVCLKRCFLVHICAESADHILARAPGTPWRFADANEAFDVLRELGISISHAEPLGFEPSLVGPPKADVGEAQRLCGVHDSWFREQVRNALAKDATGRAAWHTHSEVFAELEAD